MYDVVSMPDLIDRFFSSRLWLALFIASVIYLFFRVKSAQKRAILATIVAFFLIVNVFVIQQFTKLGENSTFYRHLWAIPSITIIGIAVVDLIWILPKWFLRIPAILAFAIFLWFANQEPIRCRGLHFSRDAKMVQEDVITLADYLEVLHHKDEKESLFVVCPTGYGMQYGDFDTELSLYGGFLNAYDSSFLTDANHNGEMELTGDNPDVTHIMSTCCSCGIDYVIVTSNENSEKRFMDEGYEPIISAGAYNLYRCEGYTGYKQEWNKWGLIKWKSWHDENGMPTLNEKGYSVLEYQYDHKGRIIKESYADTSGHIANCIEGYAVCERQYGENGLETISFFDSEGKPCVKKNHGYSTIWYMRNKNGQIIEERYYNEKKELINYDYQNPRAIIRYSYNDDGDLVSTRFFDTNNNPSKALSGYDEIRYEYDDSHRIIRISYYASEKLVNRFDTGYAEIRYMYNEASEVESTQYYDQYENIVEPKI